MIKKKVTVVRPMISLIVASRGVLSAGIQAGILKTLLERFINLKMFEIYHIRYFVLKLRFNLFTR